MKNMGNDIVLFMDGNIQLEVPVSRDGESVWLSANQMAVLFDKDETNIRKHINNVFRSSEVDKNNNTQKMRVDGVKQPVAFYSLDVILAVGYRVNSQRGIAFRKWANNVLKQFILKGYAINEKRLQALKKTVDIQSRMLADALEIEEKDVLRAVNEYTDALILLDQYDHQALSKPEGSTPVYRITYEECVQMVGQMKDSFETDVFGVEKEAGKVEGIIAAVYQSVFGQDAYPSLEEKAANLLYFMIKDHPYADGCKRIAASLFLEFLDKNNALFLDGEKRLSDTFASERQMTYANKTISKHIDHLTDAFLISKASRYDIKGRKYIGANLKYYFTDLGLRNARLNFRQQEPTHIMENIVYNELLIRGYNVDVGVVDIFDKDKEGKRVRKQLEVDFVVNQGNQRYYIQVAYDMTSEEKQTQEFNSLRNIPDSFKKIVIVNGSKKPWRNDEGFVIMGMKYFLLNANSLEF